MIETIYTQNTRDISHFLRALADKIEDNLLSEDNMKQIGEFYMRYSFMNRYDESEGYSDDESYEESETENNIEDDYLKFISLGWYIYNHCLNSN